MKLLFFILTALLLCAGLSAQQKFNPAFGKVDKADLEMKECSFDNTAEALVLFDVGEVYCDLNLRSVTGNYVTTELTRHVRIKILNDNGLSQANIKIPYYSERNLEDISNLTAQTINLDAAGNIVYTKVDKNLIYRKKINKRRSEVIFTFPEVKKGSIIEYRYIEKADDLIAVHNWYFQKPIPVKMSRYIMNFPHELIINATTKGALHVDAKDEDKSYRYVKTYSMQDIPALRNEPYISCDDDYMQQVIPIMQAIEVVGQPRVNLLRTWPGIIKELMEDEDFGLQLKRNIPRTADLDEMLKKISDPYQKMVVIHDYVRKNMKWNEFYGIWASDGVKSAWKDKKGTTGEINLILVNLLKDAGINVHPVLVSTRSNGMINTGTPSIRQFDKVLAYVTIGSNKYVLDATDKYTPANMIPSEVMYSEGLVIEKLDTYEWGWKVLWDPNKMYKNIIFLSADIDEKGTMKGSANISSYDYSRVEKMPMLKKGTKQFIEAYYTSKNAGFNVDSFSVDNEDIDTLPLTQHVNFTSNTNSSGDYHYFNTNLFSGFEKNPFLADDRTSDIFFGNNQKHMLISRFTIPDGYTFDELPKNVKMIMPDTSIVFSRVVSVSDNELSMKVQIDIKKPIYSPDEYPYFQEFYKRLFELLSEQIVFKKK